MDKSESPGSPSTVEVAGIFPILRAGEDYIWHFESSLVSVKGQEHFHAQTDWLGCGWRHHESEGDIGNRIPSAHLYDSIEGVLEYFNHYGIYLVLEMLVHESQAEHKVRVLNHSLRPLVHHSKERVGTKLPVRPEISLAANLGRGKSPGRSAACPVLAGTDPAGVWLGWAKITLNGAS